MSEKLFRPFVVGVNDAWGLGAGATKVIAVNPGNPPVPDRSTHIESASVNSQDFKPRKDFTEKMDSVASVTAYLDVDDVTGGSSIRFRITDSTGIHLGTPFDPADNPKTYSLTRNTRFNGTPWTEAELRHADFSFGVDNLNATWVQAFALWAYASYTPDIDYKPFGRLTVSQMVHEFVLRHGLVSLKLPIEAMDLRLMDHFFLTHPEGPHPDAEGWKDLDWQRRLLRTFGIQFDPDGDLQSVLVEALDLRKYLTYLRDTGVSPYSLTSAEDLADGPLRLDLGVTRTMTRATVATIEDVGGVVVEIASGKERIGPDGTLIEDYRKNFAKGSSFKGWAGGPAAAPDGWTEQDGDAKLTIARVTNGIFESSLLTYGCRLTSIAAGGDYGLNQVNTFQWENDDNGVLSIDHEDHSQQGLNVGLRRSSDNWWWNPATGLWGAAFASKILDVAPAGTIVRDHIPFDNGAGITDYVGTYLIYIRAHQANHDVTLHHVQLEGGNIASGECKLWAPTSRIITEISAAVPRNADDLWLETNPTQGRRIVHPDHGTLFVRLNIDYGLAALTDPRLVIARWLSVLSTDVFDAEDFNLYYCTGSPSEFLFRFHEVYAHYYTDLAAGEYVFAMRWTSDKGELGLPNWSVDLFVNGDKGTSDAGSQNTELDSVEKFYYGRYTSMTGYNRPNGWISRLFSTPFVLTDKEIKAWTDRMTS